MRGTLFVSVRLPPRPLGRDGGNPIAVLEEEAPVATASALSKPEAPSEPEIYEGVFTEPEMYACVFSSEGACTETPSPANHPCPTPSPSPANRRSRTPHR